MTATETLQAHRSDLSGLGAVRRARKAWRCICADNFETAGGFRNPEYRPDCPSPDISPGDTYFEYMGEVACYGESGDRYCAGCAVAVWVER